MKRLCLSCIDPYACCDMLLKIAEEMWVLALVERVGIWTNASSAETPAAHSPRFLFLAKKHRMSCLSGRGFKKKEWFTLYTNYVTIRNEWTAKHSREADSMSRIHSVKGLFGQIIHYDEQGTKVGESWPGLFSGSLDHYDADGNYAGYTQPGVFADGIHYDAQGNKTGETWGGLFGQENHYDSDGNFVGDSWDTLTGIETDLDDWKP